MMRKVFRIMSIAAFTLFALACTKSETIIDTGGGMTDRIPILLDTYSEFVPESKALITEDNFNTSGNQIKVYDVYISDDKRASLYMDGVLAKSSGTSWSYDPLRYWTQTGIHSFTAITSGYYAETSDGSRFLKIKMDSDVDSGDNVVVSGPVVEYDYEYDKNSGTLVEEHLYVCDDVVKDEAGMTTERHGWQITPENQFDLLYAHNTRKMTETNPYRPVTLEMKHLFCALQFNVSNLLPNDVTFNGLTLTDLYDTGQADIVRSNGAGDAVPNLSLDKSGNPINVTNLGITLSLGDKYNVFGNQGNIGTDGCLLMWPHDKDKLSGVSASLDFSSPVGTKSIPLSGGSISQWTAGNKYVYDIYIQDNYIYFTVNVVEWVDDFVILEER